MDRVLAVARPAFDAASVVDIARRTFGVEAAAARDLGSERDQTFLLLDADDAPLAVLKLSNAAEDPATLDMEALAVPHAHRGDPPLPPQRLLGREGGVKTGVSPGARRPGGGPPQEIVIQLFLIWCLEWMHVAALRI